MRVLMLSWEYPPLVVGGLARHVHGLAQGLRDAGHEVTVVTRHAPGTPLDSRDDGIRIVRVPEDPPEFDFFTDLLAWSMAFNHALTRTVLRVLDEDRPEVIHAHDWLVAHAAVTAKHAAQLPLVATMHATEAGRHLGWLPEAMNRSIHSVEWWLTYEARRVIACSSHMRTELGTLFELADSTIDVIPNGVDARFLEPPARGDRAGGRAATQHEGPAVVFVGRLVFEKGAQDLLAAVPRLRRRHKGLRVKIVGAGPYDTQLHEQARALRLGRSVEFTGFLDEAALARTLATASCVVVPSHYEPFGLVPLEAAAVGAPIVVADTGGLAEFVEDGQTGLRYPPRDVAALADAVSAVLRDEVLSARLRRRAAAKLRSSFAWSAVANATAETYRRAWAEEQDLQEYLKRHGPRPAPVFEVPTGNLLTGQLS